MRTVILGPTGSGIRTVNIAATGPTGLWEVCGQTASGPTGLFKTVQPSASPDSRFKSLIIPGYTGGGGGGYVAKAVHFDGATWLNTTSLTSTDSPLLTFSGWAKGTATGLPHSWLFFDFDPAVQESGPFIDSLGLLLKSYYANGYVVFSNGDTSWTDDIWHHVFGYVDTDHPAGEKIIKLFLDGVDVTGAIQDVGANFILPFSGIAMALPDSTADYPTPEFTGDYADWWIAPGVMETDITIFRDSITGKPKNPSGFPSGAVLFSGDATTFVTNQGTGGTFTLTGSLTNATTSPSD